MVKYLRRNTMKTIRKNSEHLILVQGKYTILRDKYFTKHELSTLAFEDEVVSRFVRYAITNKKRFKSCIVIDEPFDKIKEFFSY